MCERERERERETTETETEIESVCVCACVRVCVCVCVCLGARVSVSKTHLRRAVVDGDDERDGDGEREDDARDDDDAQTLRLPPATQLMCRILPRTRHTFHLKTEHHKKGKILHKGKIDSGEIIQRRFMKRRIF